MIHDHLWENIDVTSALLRLYDPGRDNDPIQDLRLDLQVHIETILEARSGDIKRHQRIPNDIGIGAKIASQLTGNTMFGNLVSLRERHLHLQEQVEIDRHLILLHLVVLDPLHCGEILLGLQAVQAETIQLNVRLL